MPRTAPTVRTGAAGGRLLDGKRAGGVLERDRDGIPRVARGTEHDPGPVKGAAADARRHVPDDAHPDETLLERAALRRIEAHADRQQREWRPIREEPVANDSDLARGHAPDVMTAIGEEDQRRTDGVRRQVLRRAIHGRDVVRVDADPPCEGRIETLPICRRDGSQAAGELRDGPRAAEELQIGTSRVVDRPWRRTGRSTSVVSPAMRSDDVASTRSAIRSSAAPKRFRSADSSRIEAEKSRTMTTSDGSGAGLGADDRGRGAADQQRRHGDRDDGSSPPSGPETQSCDPPGDLRPSRRPPAVGAKPQCPVTDRGCR